MKYSMEMDASEFGAIMKLLGRIVDAAQSTETLRLKNEHDLAVIRAKKEAGQRRHTFIVDEGDEDSDDDSESPFIEGYSEEEIETPPPIHFTVHSNKEEEPKVDTVDEDVHIVRYSQGEATFSNLVKMWLIGFCYPPDADAPASTDRGDEMKRLSLAKEGRKMLYYLENVGGLTQGVKEVWPESDQPGKIRYVAENIAQVGSILFNEVSDLLEYPNPLEE